jgi:hypothetical protein
MAIGSALGSVQRRPALPKKTGVPASEKASQTSKVVDVSAAAKVSHASMTLERSDAQVSKGLGGLERALAASGLVSDNTDDPDGAEAIVNAQLVSWSSGFVTPVVERRSPEGTFDEQLDGLNAGLAKPDGVLQWHGNKKRERPDHHEELVQEEISRALPPAEEDRAVPREAHAVPLETRAVLVEEAIATWPVEDEIPALPALAALPVEEKMFTSPLTLSTDRMLKNVDSLCAAFQRIEQQLGGMDLLCQALMAAQ